MEYCVDSQLYSDWEDSIKNSKTRDADFDSLSGHPLDACYFPKTIDENYKNLPDTAHLKRPIKDSNYFRKKGRQVFPLHMICLL